MYNKTTNHLFQKYGEVFQSSFMPKKRSKIKSREIKKISCKSIKDMVCLDQDLYIKVHDGEVLLVITDDINISKPDTFVVHRVTKINAGIYFNFISITKNAKIEYYPKFNFKNHHTKLNNQFNFNPIVPSVSIKEILASYYSVRNPNYKFTGEVHSHWELTVVDNGQLKTTIDNRDYTLENYQMIFYAPGQYHTQSTTNSSSSYLTIIFDMDCNDINILKNKVFSGNQSITSAINNFVRISDNKKPFSNDLMICYLKEIVVRLLYSDLIEEKSVILTPMQQKFQSELLNEVIIYITDNIYKKITIEELCHHFALSRSSLQQLFKSNLEVAPKQYISDLKLRKSQVMIKESKYSISEISNLLGFSSIHYFSRKFKQHFNITPTDYAKSIYK
ncbi:MAG: helix-turn-helix transcriptional regulator [Anaerorhabdus sp.]